MELEPEAAVLASTVRPVASVPDTDHPCALVSSTVRSSLNVTVMLSRAVATAVTVGGRPSDTGMEERAASALDAKSVIAPEPEPASLPTSPVAVL